MYKSIYRLNIENEKQSSYKDNKKKYIIAGALASGGLAGGGIALNKYLKNSRLKDEARKDAIYNKRFGCIGLGLGTGLIGAGYLANNIHLAAFGLGGITGGTKLLMK